jgi:hypothetical protein
MRKTLIALGVTSVLTARFHDSRLGPAPYQPWRAQLQHPSGATRWPPAWAARLLRKCRPPMWHQLNALPENG